MSNPKLAFSNFFKTMDSVRDLAFPEIKVKAKLTKFKHNPWMSSGLKVSKKRKDALFAKKVKCPSDNNVSIFKLYNKLYNKVRRSAKKMYYDNQIVKTPTTTSIQLNTTTIDVGFDTIMTVHTHHPPTRQELYPSYTNHAEQCKLTQSYIIILDYLRQLS